MTIAVSGTVVGKGFGDDLQNFIKTSGSFSSTE